MQGSSDAVHGLDDAIALAGEPGSWTASIASTWFLIADTPHGGVSAALLMNAAKLLDPSRSIRTATVQLMAPMLGEITVEAVKLRETRSLSVVSVTASVEGRTAATASIVMGSTIESTMRRDFANLPDVPVVEDCPDLVSMAPDMFPRFVTNHLDFRAALGVPFSGGDNPELAGWIRLKQPRPVDDLVVAVLLDALPSAISVIAHGFKIAPTVEYSLAFDQAAIAQVGSDQWTLCHARNWAAGDGWSFEDADLFTADGTLLAKGRQLRRLGF